MLEIHSKPPERRFNTEVRKADTFSWVIIGNRSSELETQLELRGITVRDYAGTMRIEREFDILKNYGCLNAEEMSEGIVFRKYGQHVFPEAICSNGVPEDVEALYKEIASEKRPSHSLDEEDIRRFYETQG